MKTNFLKVFAAVMMLFSFSSFVLAENLTITVTVKDGGENVTVTENAATVSSQATVEFASAEGAVIYYTTDGSNPSKPSTEEGGVETRTESASQVYSDAISMENLLSESNKTVTIKAIAYKEAAEETKATETESDVVTITLTLKEETEEPTPEKLAAPTFKVDGAEVSATYEFEGENVSVTIEAASGATIRYTTDADVTLSESTGTEYTAAVEISEACTLKAIAIETGKTASDVAELVITKKASETPVDPEPAKVAAPTFVSSNDTVVVVKGEADSIFVAMGVDSAAALTNGFAKFTGNDTIKLAADTVILAYAMKGEVSSDTVKYEFKKAGETPVDPQPEKVAAPVINKLNDTTVVVLKGEADSIFVAMGVDSAAALTNGFAKFTGNDTIKLAADTVILAYAMKGEESSDTVKYEFKKAVSSANETKELAGVSVYPNPSNGEFNVSVAENVTVEVFNTNGQIVKRARLNAGVNAMQLNNSGIYFVRFTAANGQVAIKKVVVR